jgi:hypothetical protein
VAREAAADHLWDWTPVLPRVDEPMEVSLQTTVTGLPQGIIGPQGGLGSISFYLAQDAVLPFYWQGHYWPEVAGWTTLHTLMGDTTWAYMWPRGAWATLYRERRRRETLAYIGEMEQTEGDRAGQAKERTGGDRVGQARDAERGTTQEVKTREEVVISKYWWYFIFLICVLFLWVERKMGGMNGKTIQ